VLELGNLLGKTPNLTKSWLSLLIRFVGSYLKFLGISCKTNKLGCSLKNEPLEEA
jgi:hypothetical protein